MVVGSNAQHSVYSVKNTTRWIPKPLESIAPPKARPVTTTLCCLTLLEQTHTAEETAKLYTQTIFLQTRQALQTDQQPYAQDKVEFNRIIRDFRSVITLEIGYHRSFTEMPTALAKI